MRRRNDAARTVDWRFTAAAARIKLKHAPTQHMTKDAPCGSVDGGYLSQMKVLAKWTKARKRAAYLSKREKMRRKCALSLPMKHSPRWRAR